MLNDGSVLFGLARAIAVSMSVALLVHVYVIVVPYVRHQPSAPGDPGQFEWHFLIPCRDEEFEVGPTVRYLRTTFPQAHVWVIDDDSEDRTADVVEGLRYGHGAASRFIHLVRRHRPDARTGRPDALNAAYRALRSWIGRHSDTDRQIVVVIDANSRPAANCLATCSAAALFGDARIGAVQVDVRMGNKGTAPPHSTGRRRWLGAAMVRMQDLEFRTAIAAVQKSRSHNGTISLGDNGQFARLSALDSIAGASGTPWHGALLADFELGVHLLTEGWRTGFTMDTHVDQEGLDSLRRFLVQRTGQSHGTMRCTRYVRRIWSSEHLSTPGAVELLYQLAQPWLQLLGTLVYPIPLVLLAGEAASGTGGAWKLCAVYGSLGVLPFLIWGPVYWWKCERRSGLLRSLWYGVGYTAYVYTFYVTSWRAVLRLARGHHGLARTRSNAEVPDGVIALDH